MPLRPVEPKVSFPALEEALLDRWEADRIFERSVEERAEAESYAFYDGPPFATGLPHYGHLVASTLKDVVPRYWTMKGRRVERRWGWDCHGLPVENEAQKELGLASVRDVDELGIEKFNQACRGLVQRYSTEWRSTIRRMGRWVDFDRGYRTMDPDFMETVWWAFRQLWDQGRIYEGHRVSPVSPALGTPLSNFEVALGPQEKDPETKKDGHLRVQDPSVVVRFALEDEEASLWAWTTTPWTLPSNLALAVHPEVEYVRVRVVSSGEVVYLEPSRLAALQERDRVGETEELARLKGAELVGRPYAPLLPYFADLAVGEDGTRQAFRVVAAEYVDTASGTGIVHQAPAFGEDDFQTGQREGLPLVNPLDRSGIFDESVPDFAGQFAKDADKGILARLKEEGKLVDQDTIVHAYPHCYRTDKPLLYMALSTWFMKVEELRSQLVASNDQVRWVPEAVGSGRFGNWLEGARDWNLSRNRYWGTPLPVWRCDEDPSDMVCVGSRAELEELAGLEAGSITDLHRDSIDGITFPSRTTPGGTMRRISEVFDCWFESGAMPYAQNHYPFENREAVEANLPAEFIAEGLDQTRGWFYTLTVLSTALFGRPAFKNVIVNGTVLAEDGEKMSKSKRNFPDPNIVLEKYGADALRLYLIDSPVMNAKDLRFEEAGVQERIRAVMLPLWNAYSFLTKYAEVNGWEPDGVAPDPALNDLDGWVLSRLQSLVGTVEQNMARYELFRVVPALVGFVDELTNWYIRRSRGRFQNGTLKTVEDPLVVNAFRTLHHVLVTLSRALAPFLPFVSEEIHSNLAGADGADSVHLCDYPTADPAWIDPALERRMELARRAVSLGRSLREQHGVRVRQALGSLIAVAAEPEDRAALEAGSDLIADELNVKQVEISADESELVSYAARPNLKVLGPKYGKQLKDIKEELAGLSSDALARIVGGEGLPSASVVGLVYDASTLLIDRQAREGTVTETEEGVTVALDLTITPELRQEGLAREVINRVQNQRRTADLAFDDRIQLDLACPAGELQEAIREHWSGIAAEVLAVNGVPDLGAGVPGGEEQEVEGTSLVIGLSVA
jgi:isoleucyl-tRNA synthetase